MTPLPLTPEIRNSSGGPYFQRGSGNTPLKISTALFKCLQNIPIVG